MQTFNIIYRVSSLAPGVQTTAPQAAIVVAMGLPDARRIIADDIDQAAHHITIMHHTTIHHGECMHYTETPAPMPKGDRTSWIAS